MKKIFVSCLFFFLFNQLLAQEQRVFSQFFMNPYIYNPAYVGVEGHTALFVMHRAQYSGLQGGPSFSHVTFHTPLKGGVGIGGMAFNEQEGGILNTSGFKVSAGYLAAFDRKHYLRFGMSLGAGTTTLDASDPAIAADIFGDPAFANLSNKYLIADFGVTYHFDHFNFGVSIPNLVGREVISSETFSPIKISPLDNILIKMNYRGHIGHDFALEPHLLYRYSHITTSQYEAALIAHIKHIVWVGASYREGAGINALVGFKVKEKLGIGYAFELGNSDISSITGNTHELHIGYHLSSHKKHHGHHSSFIKSHKLTAEERAKLAEQKLLKQEQKEKREAERLAKLNQKDTPKQNEVETTEKSEVIEKEIESNETPNNTITENPKTNQEEFNTKPDNSKSNAITESETNNSKPETSTGKPAIGTNTTITSPVGAPRMKRGTHYLELPPGNHIVAGAFSEFEHAEDFSDTMFERGFHDTILGYQSEKGYYYVVIFSSDEHSKAATQRSRIRKSPGMEKVWILTVE